MTPSGHLEFVRAQLPDMRANFLQKSHAHEARTCSDLETLTKRVHRATFLADFEILVAIDPVPMGCEGPAGRS